MKKTFVVLLLTIQAYGQSVLIDPRATVTNIIDAKSTQHGVTIPKMTSIEKSNIPNKIEGMMVYDIDAQQFSYWTGSIWVNFGNAAANTGWQSNGQDAFSTGTGRVGIGTNIGNTYAKLTINADNLTKTNAIFGSNGSGISLQKGPAAIGFNTYTDANGANNVRYITDGFGLINRYENLTGKISWNTLSSGYALGFAGAETRLMTLTQDGKLGIGLNEPTNKLQVGPSNSTSNFDLHIGNTDGGSMSFIQYGNATNAGLSRFFTNSRFAFTHSGSNDLMFGIGTTNPINHLQIGENSSPSFSGNQIAAFNNSGSGMSVALSGNAVSGSTIFYTNSKFSLMPYGGGNGNLGIGTTTPETKLVVKGGVSMPIKTVSGNYTIQDNDYTIIVNSTADTTFITLPSLNIEGRIINIVNYTGHYIYIGSAIYPRVYSLYKTYPYYSLSHKLQCVGPNPYLHNSYTYGNFSWHWHLIDSDYDSF